MSHAYQRLKMRVTTVAVDQVRSFCDGCNVVINAFARPLRRVGQRINSESPWVIGVAACTLVTIIPLIGYPLIKKYVMPDPRAEAEAERVRLCLQKGIDPYPYMRHKDYVYGNNAPVLAMPDQNPEKIGWEYDSLHEFQRRKEELRKETGGNVEDTVQKLMEMKRKQRGEYDSLIGSIAREPKNLVFHGRGDVDQVKS